MLETSVKKLAIKEGTNEIHLCLSMRWRYAGVVLEICFENEGVLEICWSCAGDMLRKRGGAGDILEIGWRCAGGVCSLEIGLKGA